MLPIGNPRSVNKKTPEHERFLRYWETYEKGLPDPPPIVDPNAANPSSGANRAIASRTARYGQNTVSQGAMTRLRQNNQNQT